MIYIEVFLNLDYWLAIPLECFQGYKVCIKVATTNLKKTI